MGLRRLRGRLDQLQANANFTMAEIQALVDDLQDGFGITIEVDEAAARKIMSILTGHAGTFPVRLKIDPQVDA